MPFFLILKRLRAPKRSWKIFHGVPGKVLDFFVSKRVGTLFTDCRCVFSSLLVYYALFSVICDEPWSSRSWSPERQRVEARFLGMGKFVFVISGLQSVTYWKNFCHVRWVSYVLYVINCMCAVFWHTCTFSDYINRLCRHTVESYCVSWIYCPIIC